MPEAWPDWRIDQENLAALAGYVARDQPRLLPMGPELREKWTTRAEGAARVEQLHELLASRNIRYATEAFGTVEPAAPGGGTFQRIRSAEEVLQGVGTCLDLSLLFANLAVVADVRPLIAVRLDCDPHAMVVLDVGRPLSERDPSAPDDWRPDASGVVFANPAGGWRPGRRWLAVDAVGLTSDDRQPVVDDSELHVGTWFLVDVVAAWPAFPPRPQPEGAIYPIHTHLPELREFHDYPSRTALRRRLETDLRTKRRVVIHGKGGRGKSMLAERLAWGADHGCGWVLTASDVPTLQASLAAAERAERGLADEVGDRGEVLDGTEIRQYARAALDRLRSTTVPWVVVLDNCDLRPDTPGLDEWMPRPGAEQVVIITTRNSSWSDAGDAPVEPLESADMELIGLPADAFEHPLAANPLTAETAARLGLDLSVPVDGEPEEAIWDLVREALGPDSRAVALATQLAWLPPEPVDVARAPGASEAENLLAAHELVRLRFVAPTTGLAAELVPGETGEGTVGMHRLYGEAIRRVLLRDATAAAESLAEVLGGDWGRSVLTRAIERTTLSTLTTDVVPELAKRCGARHTVGTLWQGLGHAWERRGAVERSATLFTNALELLDVARDPYGAAEAKIGIARYINQMPSPARYDEAQALVEEARTLLRIVTGTDADRLAAQGGALYWIIEQHKASRDADPGKRLDRLLKVREELWLSYEERMRLWGGAERIERVAPPPEAGLGPERGYYNLAGVHLAIAKARHAAGEPDGVEQDLAACREVYGDVARLRTLRYADRPHPHRAACTNGLSMVEYHRMTLLRDRSALPRPYEYGVAALRERWTAEEEKDVRKSAEFLVKVALAGVMTTAQKDKDPVEVVNKVIAKALAELTDWLG